jgi:AraC-like DNA-binding protein/ABC-type thiamin/hydroxymethylpyrimidine transport system permease subunit
MPVTLDLYAIFIFLGIVQGLFVGLFFVLDKPQKQYNIFHGFALLCIALTLLEIWLDYTGYIQFSLWLVDFSEPLALLIAPFTYLYVKSLIDGKVQQSHVWKHLLLPGLYLLAMIPFWMSSDDLKYNSWLFAYHPNAPLRPLSEPYPEDWLWITDHHLLFVVISFVFYLVLVMISYARAARQKNEPLLTPKTPTLRTIRAGMIVLAAMIVGLLIVKFVNPRDTGDQYIAILATVAIYFTSFFVIKNSAFFRQTPVNEPARTKTSGISPEDTDRIAVQLLRAMEQDKVFMQTDVTVASLGKVVNKPAYVVSQVINERFNKGFFEWIAEYRVREAKRILKASPHLKIEEVAEQVGYNSKSSFNTSFKKLAGVTPSEYRDSETIDN